MQTTIDIPDPLRERVEKAAARSGVSVPELIVSTLRAQFRGRESAQSDQCRVTLPLIRSATTKKIDLNREQIDPAMFG